MNAADSRDLEQVLRARHDEALARLSPRTRAALAQRRHAALRGEAAGAGAARRPALRYAALGVATLCALALGLQLQRPAPATVPAAMAAAPRADVLLDEDPEFYAWLGSADAQRLAME